MIETSKPPNEMCIECGSLCCNSMLLLTSGMSAEDVQYWGTIGRAVGVGVVVDMKCRQLVDGKCSMYDLRPTKCRDFAVGGPTCQALRHAYGKE